MKKAKIFVDNHYAGLLIEIQKNKEYQIIYSDNYRGPSISLTLPSHQKIYLFQQFPPFFEGLLPEGPMLEALLKKTKIDTNDLFEQLMKVGGDMIGNITVKKIS